MDAQVLVSERCRGKSRCEVLAGKSLFGDPCPNLYKYMQVEYTCQY